MTEAKEFVKQYIELDGQGRVESVYTARATATSGQPCSKTTYGYAGLTSTVIIKRKEELSTWDPAATGTWEI